MSDLPLPQSEGLLSLLGSTTHQTLYGFLYRRRSHPPTMVELRAFAADAFGEDHSQVDRRVRELRRFFDIQVVLVGGEHRYLLVGMAATAPDPNGISQRRRAEVLAPQRCAMCGRTPLDDHIKLVVDHKIPQAWGGSNEIENLQPLCEECNAGKRDYFQTYDQISDKIREAVNYDEPQRRIGELLLAFRGVHGGWVRTDVIGIVASAKEYQEDWQRRLRDLRFLGWKIESQKRYTEGTRVWTYYRVTESTPWPKNIRASITREEARRRDAKRRRSDYAFSQPVVDVQLQAALDRELLPGQT